MCNTVYCGLINININTDVQENVQIECAFYDTSYDINQITWIHNIDVTLQLVSAQKDAYASEL